MKPFTPMVEVLTPCESEHFKLEQFTVSQEDADFHNMMVSVRGHHNAVIHPGDYMRLITKDRLGGIWMSDTPYEQSTNRYFVEDANGDIFIAGLGIGMVLVPLLQKEDVRSITVVEKSQEVIGLIEPQIRNRFPAECANKKLIVCFMDVFDCKPALRYDTIYFDIWPDICADNWQEMKTLHRRFRRFVNRDNPKSFMTSWQKEWCQELARRDREMGW